VNQYVHCRPASRHFAFSGLGANGIELALNRIELVSNRIEPAINWPELVANRPTTGCRFRRRIGRNWR
jgi:hypothetical protein